MQKKRWRERVEQDERWGVPVTGFPRVGDEATEEHDKRTIRHNGHGAHKGKHFIQHNITRVIVSGYTFGTLVSGRFEIVEEGVVLAIRRGSRRSRGDGSCTRYVSWYLRRRVVVPVRR